MMTQMMVKPSSWVATGITVAKVRDRYLFKFSEELQSRLDELNQRLKTDQLTETERAELAGILESVRYSISGWFMGIKGVRDRGISISLYISR